MSYDSRSQTPLSIKINQLFQKLKKAQKHINLTSSLSLLKKLNTLTCTIYAINEYYRCDDFISSCNYVIFVFFRKK